MVQARSAQEPDRRVRLEGHCGARSRGEPAIANIARETRGRTQNAPGEAGGVSTRREIQREKLIAMALARVAEKPPAPASARPAWPAR